MTIRTILCPVDFSSTSERAFEYAVTLAGNLDAALRLVHVNSPVPVMMTHPVALTGAPTNGGDLERRRENTARALLDQMETRARGAGVQVTSTVHTGDVDRELYSEITETKPDLAVMGTHARQGFDRWLYGSVTEKTIRHCPVSILAIPESQDTVGPVPPGIGRILMATDSVRGIERMLDATGPLHADAEIEVLHVIGEPAESRDALVGLSTVLDRIASRRGMQRDRFVPQIEVGAPDDRILTAAARSRPDLIVVNPHDRGAFARLLSRSTTVGIVREAPCPVMTVPDQALGESPGLSRH